MSNWVEPHPRRLPTSLEIEETHATVQQLDSEIDDLVVQISRLQDRVRQLKQERAQRLSFVAPFRRLPPELLVPIVELCINAGDPPTVLNSVCSSMRTAVNGMKRLWGTIHIVPQKLSPKRREQENEESQGRLSRRGKARSVRPSVSSRRPQKDGHFCVTIEHLQTLLERADGTSVDVSITYPDAIDEAMIQLMASHTSNFRSMAVVLSASKFEFPVVDLPALENLQIHSPSLNSSVRHILQMADERAPRLSNVTLEIPKTPDFRLTEVARYQFYYRLKTLYLATGSKGPSDPSAPVVDLPELQTLTLVGKPWILAYMNLPNLSTLTILGGTTKRNQRVIPPHFPTSITRLHLDHARFTTSTSTAVLLPHLTHLDLRYPSIEVLDPHFRMPALETMRMDSITYNGLFRASPEQSTLSALFNGEGVLQDLYSLRRLLLEEIHLETTSCAVFRGIPALQEWELRGCSVPHDLPETLAGKILNDDEDSNNSVQLLGRLGRLHVKHCWSMSDTADTVEGRVKAAGTTYRPELSIVFTDNQE